MDGTASTSPAVDPVTVQIIRNKVSSLVDESYLGGTTNDPTYIISVATPVGYAPTLIDQTTDDLDSDDPSGTTTMR